MGYDDYDEEFQATAKFKEQGSSLVEEVGYDADTRELLLFFRSGTGYVYEGVSPDVYRSFTQAHSKGQFYNNHIKRQFGPGIEVAYGTVIVDKTTPAPDMGPVTTTTVSGVSPIRVHSGGPSSSQYSLTFSPNPDQFINVPSATFSLARPDTVVDAVEYVVHFTVEGGNSVKTANVETSGNFQDAIEKISDSLDALGLDYAIKGVFVVE